MELNPPLSRAKVVREDLHTRRHDLAGKGVILREVRVTPTGATFVTRETKKQKKDKRKQKTVFSLLGSILEHSFFF
jgi:hypothetical protein